jgi:hypothetical protein
MPPKFASGKVKIGDFYQPRKGKKQYFDLMQLFNDQHYGLK